MRPWRVPTKWLMRISELRGLARDAADFARRLIIVRQCADEFGEIGPPRSRAGDRDIPTAPAEHRTLGSWRSEAPESAQGWNAVRAGRAM